MAKIEGRGGSDKDFEAKLRRSEGPITMKAKNKKLVMDEPEFTTKKLRATFLILFCKIH
jgi:hypothetical protein